MLISRSLCLRNAFDIIVVASSSDYLWLVLTVGSITVSIRFGRAFLYNTTQFSLLLVTVKTETLSRNLTHLDLQNCNRRSFHLDCYHLNPPTHLLWQMATVKSHQLLESWQDIHFIRSTIVTVVITVCNVIYFHWWLALGASRHFAYGCLFCHSFVAPPVRSARIAAQVRLSGSHERK